jgi:hypothetical protein
LARSRPQFFLADLVAIVALGGLLMAAVRSEEFSHFAGIIVLIWLLGIAWVVFRQRRTAPTCEECGRPFFPPRKKLSPAVCPQCGQPRPQGGRESMPLVISFWTVLALLLVSGAIVSFATIDFWHPPPTSLLWMALVLIVSPLGMLVLLALFVVLFVARGTGFSTARSQAQPCEKCGSIGTRDESAGPRICPRCRLRHLSGDELRKEQAKGAWIILALVTSIALVIGFVLPGAFGFPSGGNSWIAVVLGTVAAMVGLCAALFVALVLFVLVRQFRLKSESYVLSLARKASGDAGEVVRSGLTMIWFSAPPDPAPALIEQMESIRGRIDSTFGTELGRQPPLRILCFAKRSGFEAFLGPFAASLRDWLRTQNGIYIRQPSRIVVLCGEASPVRVGDWEETARSLLCTYFLEFAPASSLPYWLQRGICGALSIEDDRRARFNRKMLAALARGGTLGMELLTIDEKGLMKQIRRSMDLRSFAGADQTSTEAWSLFEFLCGKQAPATRLAQLRAFLGDNQSKSKPTETFARHFGFGFDSFSECWRVWVADQGARAFALPAPPIEDGLVNRVIPLIENRQAKRGDRVLAIRYIGADGHVLAADALIGLLRGDESISREEVVWALEAISGMAYGDDQDRWSAWWETLPIEIRERCRRHAEGAATA